MRPSAYQNDFILHQDKRLNPCMILGKRELLSSHWIDNHKHCKESQKYIHKIKNNMQGN